MPRKKKIQDMDRRPRQPSCLAHGQEAYLAKEANPALVEDHLAHQVALEVLHHLGLIPRARALRVLPHEEAAEGVAELGHLDVEAQEVPRCKEALPGDQRVHPRPGAQPVAIKKVKKQPRVQWPLPLDIPESSWFWALNWCPSKVQTQANFMN